MLENKGLAMQLLLLIRDHKKKCNSSNCFIQTSEFRELFEELMGRKATQEEIAEFY